jgi:hypothetical protein
MSSSAEWAADAQSLYTDLRHLPLAAADAALGPPASATAQEKLDSCVRLWAALGFASPATMKDVAQAADDEMQRVLGALAILPTHYRRLLETLGATISSSLRAGARHPWLVVPADFQGGEGISFTTHLDGRPRLICYGNRNTLAPDHPLRQLSPDECVQSSTGPLVILGWAEPPAVGGGAPVPRPWYDVPSVLALTREERGRQKTEEARRKWEEERREISQREQRRWDPDSRLKDQVEDLARRLAEVEKTQGGAR